MSYADTMLASGEHVLYRARQHWLAPISDARNGLLLLLAAIVLLFVNVMTLHLSGFVGQAWGIVTLILFLVGSGWMTIVYFSWRAEEYVITNRRVLKVEGLIDKKSADSSLEKINDAVLTQGILGRILKFGNLDIMTAAEQSFDTYQMLNRVVDFKKAMLNAKNNLEDGGRGLAPAAAPAPAPAASGKSTSSDDVTATLAKLADLRDRGAITAAEYEAKKSDLLGRL